VRETWKLICRIANRLSSDEPAPAAARQ
jgi:hypothetical protein